MGLGNIRSLVLSSRFVFSLYVLQALFPITSILLILVPSVPYVAKVMGFPLLSIGFGLYPNGVLATTAQNIGLKNKSWFKGALDAACVAAAIGFIVSFGYLARADESILNSIWLAITVAYVFSVLIVTASAPDEEIRHRLVDRLNAYSAREMITFRTGMARTKFASRLFFKDNLKSLFALIIGLYLVVSLTDPLVYPHLLIATIGGVVFLSALTKLAVYVLSGATLILRRADGGSRPTNLGTRYWLLYGGSIGLCSVLTYYQFLFSALSLPPTYFYMLREVALDGAIVNVQLACLIGLSINIVAGPRLGEGLTKFLSYLSRVWRYSQLDRKATEIHLGSKPSVSTFQMFFHGLLEISAGVVWVVVVFPAALSPLVGLASLSLLAAIGCLSVAVYVFLDLGFRGVELDGTKISPKLLHKAWTILTVVAAVKQIISPNMSIIVVAIPVGLSAILGFTLGFLASYESAAARIRFNSRD